MINDRLANTNLDKEISRDCLIQRENFWIQKLDTLSYRTKSSAEHVNLNDKHTAFSLLTVLL